MSFSAFSLQVLLSVDSKIIHTAVRKFFSDIGAFVGYGLLNIEFIVSLPDHKETMRGILKGNELTFDDAILR